ncbi:MAG: hypothetical protein WBG92_02685, partial [Thiohalocapsa sp.]
MSHLDDPVAQKNRASAALLAGLRRLLMPILGLGGLLGINSAYLVSVTVAEGVTDGSLQNNFYLYMFLAHLVLGLVLMALVLLFGALHFRHARGRPNRYAIRAGLALYGALFALFATGLLLTRFGFFEIND